MTRWKRVISGMRNKGGYGICYFHRSKSPLWQTKIDDSIDSKYGHYSKKNRKSIFFIFIIFFIYPIYPESNQEKCSKNNNSLSSYLNYRCILWSNESTGRLKKREIEIEKLVDKIHMKLLYTSPAEKQKKIVYKIDKIKIINIICFYLHLLWN